ncbi:MAG: F-box/SEL1-like repeat protein, partial [Alphaproteobacteria bacterium]|nr:F-box/SEL1-like repeat protein [Alphaproteobacteria bacterium]
MLEFLEDNSKFFPSNPVNMQNELEAQLLVATGLQLEQSHNIKFAKKKYIKAFKEKKSLLAIPHLARLFCQEAKHRTWQAPPYIQALPSEVLFPIFSFLPHEQVIKFSIICQLWHNVALNILERRISKRTGLNEKGQETVSFSFNDTLQSQPVGNYSDLPSLVSDEFYEKYIKPSSLQSVSSSFQTKPKKWLLKKEETAFDKLEPVSFEILTQPRLLSTESFIKAKKIITLLISPIDNPTSLQVKALIKYFKLWPSFLPSLGDNPELKIEAIEALKHLFYTHPFQEYMTNNEFVEAKIRLFFAYAIKPFDENTYKSQLSVAQNCLEGFVWDGYNIKRDVPPEILYWAWKYRQDVPLFPPVQREQLWLSVLSNTDESKDPTLDPKILYASARFYEIEGIKAQEGQEGYKHQPTAQRFYQQAAEGGYSLAKLYLKHKAIPDLKDEEKEGAILSLYQEAAGLGFPYARYLIGKKLLSSLEVPQNASEIPEDLKQGLIHLFSAARQGLPQAQQVLNELRANQGAAFYLWCTAIDGLDDQARFKELEAKAQEGLAPYAHQLAQMCEDGRGVAYATPQDWYKALEQAKGWYKAASLYNIKESIEGLERVQYKMDLLQKAQGYILNKIRKGITVSFTPQHPLFEEFSEFISQLYKYSPGARYLGTCIVQQLIEEGTSAAKGKTIIKELLIQIRSKDFQAAFKQELDDEQKERGMQEEVSSSKEVAEAIQLFEALLTKAQAPQKGKSETAKFLTRSKGFIIGKIEKGIAEAVEKGQAQALSPAHPLFKEFMEFIEELQKYPGSVPEHGAHLVQQLLHFPPHSVQAKVLINGLLELVRSSKFKEGEEGDTEEDLDELRVTKLSKVNKAIELTIKPRPLLSSKKSEQEGGIPEKVKVNEALISDPRIKVYNYHFEEDNKPFDQKEFEHAVGTILSMYDRFHKEGKITQELLKDPDSKASDADYGNRDTLKKLVTNDGAPNNRFGHRIIKICKILTGEEGINTDKVKLNDNLLAVQLASWAAAGLHCKTRAEGETHKFYIANITDGKRLESEEVTLEAKVAVALAELRRSLLEKMVSIGEVERLHPIAYLEKKAGKILGLINPQTFTDPHEKIIKDRYRNISAKNIKAAIMTGNTGYTSDLMLDEGYGNSEVLIQHILA